MIGYNRLHPPPKRFIPPKKNRMVNSPCEAKVFDPAESRITALFVAKAGRLAGGSMDRNLDRQVRQVNV